MAYLETLREILSGFDFSRFPIPLRLGIEEAFDKGPDLYRLTVYSLLRDREAGPPSREQRREIVGHQLEFMERPRPIQDGALSLLQTDLNMLLLSCGVAKGDATRLQYCVGELVETFLVHELRESMLFLGKRFRDPHEPIRQYRGICTSCGKSLDSIGDKPL